MYVLKIIRDIHDPHIKGEIEALRLIKGKFLYYHKLTLKGS